MNKILKFSVFFAVLLAFFVSCQDDVPQETKELPVIAFDDDNLRYSVKVGKEITVTPSYEHVENASFSWILDGEEISNSKELVFSSAESGDNYITIKVTNEAGVKSSEILISVLDLALPTIQLTIPEKGYEIAQNSTFTLTPNVGNSDDATFLWTVNSEEVSTDKDLSYVFSEIGSFDMVFSVKNEDGEDEISFSVTVKSVDEMPITWSTQQTVYNCSLGRSIRLKLWKISSNYEVELAWSVNGEEKQRGESSDFIFSEQKEGEYNVEVSLESKNTENKVIATQNFTVNVCSKEGTYKRAVSGASLDATNHVYEYLAAPGQYINETKVYNTMQEACDDALACLNKNSIVNLGSFGGYVVVGFDHSIENDGGYNIEVLANAYKGSSEPGIVSVMQDENGDGLPNDTWYELKGSEADLGLQTNDYSVTYYRPSAPKMDVVWKDNQGGNGVVNYLGTYHSQDYYYPNWHESDTLTLYGTCLKPRVEEVSPNYWVNGEYEWGYVDNNSKVDMLVDDRAANYFKISNAVDYKGDAVELKYVDFVKIHTGVNFKAGWLGENSTEVLGIYDYNMKK